MTRYARVGMALVYLMIAGIPAYQTIRHTDLEILYLKKVYDTNNLQNNGSVKEAAVWKDIVAQHHFLGSLIKNIFAPFINRQFQIPPYQKARAALDKIPDFKVLEKSEASTARLWSLVLLIISLIYFLLAITVWHETRSYPVFSLTIISFVFLVVGVLAPAMVMVVSPAIAGFPHFVLDYEVRSVFGVISDLYASNFWIVAVCLTIFSILIPLAKTGLTIFVIESMSLPKKMKIAKFLHSISKWSMADVFVAALLLSNFAIRANDSMQANLFLGFYYFLSYCLLSMVTTTLLQNEVQDTEAISKQHPEPYQP